MIKLPDKIGELERKKMSCDWDDVQAIQDKIKHYQAKVSQGIHYEPAF